MDPEHEVEPRSDREAQDLWDKARSKYTLPGIRTDLRCPLGPGEAETWTDVVLFASHALTGQTDDLSAARDLFLERIGIDHPNWSAPQPEHTALADQVSAPTVEDFTAKLAEPGLDDEPKETRKITDKGRRREKAPTRAHRKALTRTSKKSPTYYVPVSLWVVVEPDALRELLVGPRLKAWATGPRISGLLSLVDFLVRECPPKGMPVSAALAHDYVSPMKVRGAVRPGTILEPLAVLEEIGVIERLADHIFSPHLKLAASYRVRPTFLRRKKHLETTVNSNTARKREAAPARREKRLNTKAPFRGQLLKDLALLGLSPEGHRWLEYLLKEEKGKAGPGRRMLEFIEGKRLPQVSSDPVGQVSTNVVSCPTELKPHLLIAGSPVAHCDISHAHFSILPRVLEDHVKWMQGQNSSIAEVELHTKELEALRRFISEGDVYQKFSEDPACERERAQTKKMVVKLLNWKNEHALRSPLYLRMRCRFPLTFRLVERIKKLSNKSLSPRLRHYTADVINGALQRLQVLGIAAIPDTDSIICPIHHRDVTCRVIVEEMFRVSGVCGMVGGIRFQP